MNHPASLNELEAVMTALEGVVLARSVGLPARIVAGFLGGGWVGGASRVALARTAWHREDYWPPRHAHVYP